MDLLAEVLGNLTRDNKVVIIPDWGILVKKPGDLPGLYFNEYVTFDDGKFAEAVAQSAQIGKEAAYQKIHEFVALTKRRLDIGETIDIPGIGIFRKRDDQKIAFSHISSSEYQRFLDKESQISQNPIIEDPQIVAEKAQRETDLRIRLEDESRLAATQKAEEERVRKQVAHQMRSEEDARKKAALQQRFREMAQKRDEKQQLDREKYRTEMIARIEQAEERAKLDKEASKRSLDARMAAERQRIEQFQEQSKARRRGGIVVPPADGSPEISTEQITPSPDADDTAPPVVPAQETPIDQPQITDQPVQETVNTNAPETVTDHITDIPGQTTPDQAATGVKTPPFVEEKLESPASTQGENLAATAQDPAQTLDLFEAATIDASKEDTQESKTPESKPDAVPPVVADAPVQETSGNVEPISPSPLPIPIPEAPAEPNAPTAEPIESEGNMEKAPVAANTTATPPVEAPVASNPITPPISEPVTSAPINEVPPAPATAETAPLAAGVAGSKRVAADWFDEDEEYGYVPLEDPVQTRSKRLRNSLIIGIVALLIIAGGLWATVALMEGNEKAGTPLFVEGAEDATEKGATDDQNSSNSEEGSQTAGLGTSSVSASESSSEKSTTGEVVKRFRLSTEKIGVPGKPFLWEDTREAAHVIAMASLPKPLAPTVENAELDDLAENTSQSSFDSQTDNTEPALQEDPAFQRAIKAADASFRAKNWDLAKSGYNKALELQPSSTYVKQQLRKIVTAQAKDKNAEEDYRNVLIAADKAYREANWASAKTSYEKAQSLRPRETYPKEKLTAVNEKLTAEQAAEDAKKNEKSYQAALARGETYIKKHSWQHARIAYHQAAKLKPNESYPKQRLNMIDQAEIEYNNEQKKIAKQDKYANAVKAGDEHFTNKAWTVSRAAYSNALAIFPNQEYPSVQIAKIDANIEADRITAEKAAEVARIDKLYKENIAKADVFYEKKVWDQAKIYYTKAAETKPLQSYPVAQLNNVNTEIAREDAEYRAAYTLALQQAAPGEKPNIDEAKRLLDSKQQAYRNAATRQSPAGGNTTETETPQQILTPEETRVKQQQEQALRAAASRPVETQKYVDPAAEQRRLEEEKARALKSRIISTTEQKQEMESSAKHYIVVSCCTTEGETQTLFNQMEKDGYEPKVAGTASTYIMSMRPYLDKTVGLAEAKKIQTKYNKKVYMTTR